MSRGFSRTPVRPRRRGNPDSRAMNMDHVGVAVFSISDSLRFYRDILGLRLAHQEELPSQHVKVAFLEGAGAGCSVELLEPIGAGGAVMKFLQSRGPGLHHMAFSVKDIEGEMARLGS